MISGNHDRLEAGNNIHILSSENKSTTTEDYKANRKQDIEELNRNTENSLNKRKEIFDKTKVEEKQELIQIQADVDKNHKVINSSGTPIGLVGGVIGDYTKEYIKAETPTNKEEEVRKYYQEVKNNR